MAKAKSNAVRLALGHWYSTAPIGLDHQNKWGKEQVQPDWAMWSIVFMIRGDRMDTILTPGGWFDLQGGVADRRNRALPPPITGIQKLVLTDSGSEDSYQAWGLPK